jgi:triacylglycerol lipase
LRRTAALLIAALTTCSTVVATLAAPAAADDPMPVPYQFLPTAVLGGAQTNAPGTNIWSCKPTARHPRPVVLVHGTGGNKATNWQTYGPLLKNNGYCVFALTYGLPYPTVPVANQLGGMNDMRQSARELRTFVNRVLRATGAHKVDLVGHSQGTLMPQYYVRYLGGARHVYRYISLAPLWHGTQSEPTGILAMATAAFGGGDAPVPYCVACGQFQPGSDFIKEIRRGRVATPGVRYVNIMTKYDELVVPYSSGIQAGMTNIVLQDRCAQDYSEHFQIAANPNAARLVLNHLDPAHARPLRCRIQLPFVGGP